MLFLCFILRISYRFWKAKHYYPITQTQRASECGQYNRIARYDHFSSNVSAFVPCYSTPHPDLEVIGNTRMELLHIISTVGRLTHSRVVCTGERQAAGLHTRRRSSSQRMVVHYGKVSLRLATPRKALRSASTRGAQT